jgi:hypothetical protein
MCLNHQHIPQFGSFPLLLFLTGAETWSAVVRQHLGVIEQANFDIVFCESETNNVALLGTSYIYQTVVGWSTTKQRCYLWELLLLCYLANT